MDLRARWPGLWKALGAAHADAELLERLLARYSEPHRKYHTVQHLEECFVQLDAARGLAEHPAEVELALWFHDAIYAPRRQDNEAKSADWARDSLAAAGLPAAAGERVHALVMATRHEAVPEGNDARLVVDVDLSILGAPAERFDEYELQIRGEYRWVPALLFNGKRGEILRQFLARRSIFGTALFRDRLERQARANLTRSLERLS